MQALKNPLATNDQLAQCARQLSQLTTPPDPEGRNKAMRIDTSAVMGIKADQIPLFMRQMVSVSGDNPKASIGNLMAFQEVNGTLVFSFGNNTKLEARITDTPNGIVVECIGDRTQIG